MFAWMNREALARTAELGRGGVLEPLARSACGTRAKSPGHFQQVHEIRLDCDNDVVLLKVTQLGHEPVDRLPHRPPQLLLPALRTTAPGAAVDPVLVDPETHLPMKPR